MNIERFSLEKAGDGHNKTIRMQKVIPEGWVKAPFDTAWGYLAGPGEMEGHTHEIAEIYMIFKGHGVVVVGDEEREVSCGDVVEIPSNVYHTLKNEKEGELMWAAFWWDINK